FHFFQIVHLFFHGGGRRGGIGLRELGLVVLYDGFGAFAIALSDPLGVLLQEAAVVVLGPGLFIDGGLNGAGGLFPSIRRETADSDVLLKEGGFVLNALRLVVT